MHSLTSLIKEHISLSGCISITTLGLAKFLTVIGFVLQYTFGGLGAIVALITIYSFLEKKGLLPKWIIIKDKHERNNPKSNETNKDQK